MGTSTELWRSISLYVYKAQTQPAPVFLTETTSSCLSLNESIYTSSACNHFYFDPGRTRFESRFSANTQVRGVVVAAFV